MTTEDRTMYLLSKYYNWLSSDDLGTLSRFRVSQSFTDFYISKSRDYKWIYKWLPVKCSIFVYIQKISLVSKFARG